MGRNFFTKKCFMVIALLFVCQVASAQTYTWDLEDYGGPSTPSTWSIYNDRITVAFGPAASDFFLCYSYFVIVQGTKQINLNPYQSLMDDSNDAFVIFNGFDGCDTLYTGVTSDFIIINFPSWFDISQSFSIKFSDFINDQTLDIPAGERLKTEEIPSAEPDEYLRKSLCQTMLGVEIGCADIKGWIGTYASKPALIFKGTVSSGEINLCGDDFSVTQNEQQITDFSYWPGSTGAQIEYSNCCVDISQNTTFQWAIFSFPSWFDINQPFVFSIGSVEFEFNSESACAAESAIGSGQPELAALRKFRDETLKETPLGRKAVELYYKTSPTIVNAMKNNPLLKASVRQFFKACAAAIVKFY